MKPLAVIIITYNRPADMLELVQNICSLDDADKLLEEIIIVNNASSADYSALKNFINSNQQYPIRYFDSPKNLGVAGGRNLAVQKATAPLLIMLDDDAVLGNKDALKNIVKEFEEKIDGREKAIVSFKVLYYENREQQVNAFPHKQFEKFRDKSSFETYYYAGGAHAIRRDVIQSLNYYPDDFFYGMEEYDLGYRILNRGYAIAYSDSIVMLHKESPLGRKPKKDKVRMMWVNKSKVAFRYLPKKYFYSTAIMWSLQYLRETGFHLPGFFKGWKEIAKISSSEKRSTISAETLQRLRRLEARLWY